MQMGVIGFSFKTASLEKREEKEGEFQTFFSSYPGVLLITCNRCEFYFSYEQKSLVESWLLKHKKETSFYYLWEDLFAFHHLCQVTAGLDSQLLGETEIHQQVKLAYLNSCGNNLSSSLHYFFQKAFRIAKEVRSSFPRLQAPHLGNILFHLLPKEKRLKRFSFIGNSQTNRQIISYFLKKGICHIELFSHIQTSSIFPTIPLYGRKEFWRALGADVLICASKVEKSIFQKKDFLHPSSKIIFDLGMPRNIEPQVGGLEHIQLYNLDFILSAWKENWYKVLFQKKQAHTQAIQRAEKLYALYQSKKLTKASPSFFL